MSPIRSTPIIPAYPSRPPKAKGRDSDTNQGGSLLDAKTTPQGVTIARDFTPLEGYGRQPIAKARNHKIDESSKLDRQAVLLVVEQVNWPWRWLEGLEHELQELLTHEVSHLVGHS